MKISTLIWIIWPMISLMTATISKIQSHIAPFSNRFLPGFLLLIFMVIPNLKSIAQQVPDTAWKITLDQPHYEWNKGPIVAIDQFHQNFHTLEGRYAPFARLLIQDGYRLQSFHNPFTKESLQSIDILVISDPMNEQKESAYTESEVEVLINWISQGGSLFLITDHRPDPPAIILIAQALNLEFLDAYVLNEAPGENIGPIFFRKNQNTLMDHPITKGTPGKQHQVEEVVSFTGTAFRSLDGKASPLMILKNKKTAYFADNPNKINRRTPKQDVENWLQGATLELEKGRMVIMGEAGMFTAQIILQNNTRFGMNSDLAPNNPRFLLNIMHWLSNSI